MPPIPRALRLAIRGLLVLLLVLILGLGGAYVYLKGNATRIAQDILDAMVAETGMTIKVGHVGVDLLPLPALTAADSSVEGKGLKLTIAYSSVTPDLAALIRREFVSSHVRLVRPRVNYQEQMPVNDDAKPATDAGSATPPTATDSTGTSGNDKLTLAQNVLYAFWPEDSRLQIEDGDFAVSLADGTHVAITGLDCRLKSSAALAVSGRLRVGKLLLESPSLPPLYLANIKLKGEQSLFSFSPGTPRLSLSLDVQSTPWLAQSHVALDYRGQWQQGQLEYYLAGNFLKDGKELPYVLNGQMAHDQAVAPRVVNIRATSFSLGRDSLVYDGTLRLPSAPERLLEEASIGGTLNVKRVSLTEWLGFGRLLPAGLQNTLDTVSDGTLYFDMDGKGLRVPQIVASCQGSTFTGKGGVEDWRNPVVFLDLLAPQVNLGLAIPEAVAILPEEPDYGHGPLTPEGTTPSPEEIVAKAKVRAERAAKGGTADKDDEIRVGYDIRLGADTVNYGPLVINDARVRIHPGPYDREGNSDTVLDATAKLYKGSFRGSLALGWQDWLPYTITATASGVDGKGIARDLPVLPFTGGTWQGEAKVTSKGKQLDVFLASLRGNARVDGRQGGLPVPLPRHDATTLSLSLTGGSWKDNHLGLTGQWQGSLAGQDMQLSGATSGCIWFGERTKNRDVVDFDQLRGWLRLHTQPGLLGLAKAVDARLEGDFDLKPRQIQINNAVLQALGATARGQWLLNQEHSGFAFQGPVELDIPQLATFASVWGPQVKTPKFLLNLHGKADVTASAEKFVLNKLQLKTGHTTATGTLSGQWDKKQVNANLALDTVDLDRYFPATGKSATPKAETREKNDRQTLTAASDAPQVPVRRVAPPKQPRGPATSLDYSFLKPWSAQGTLRVQSLVCRKVRLQKMHIPFVLHNGRLEVAKLDAQAYGGPVRGSGHILFGQSLGLKGRAQATNVNLASAMRERNMYMQGMAEVYADLAATLATTADWPAALGGTWRFAIYDGQFRNTDKEGQPKGSPTLFSLAQATGNITAGVVRSKDILLRGPDMVIKGSGKLDLPQENIDCEFDVNMKSLPDFPMRLYGSLDKPRTSIGAGTLILNALGGLGSGLVDTVGGLFTGIGRIFAPPAQK